MSTIHVMHQYFFVCMFCRASSEANIPMLVLANLRWLDYIVDSETLTTKMIEMIEGSPVKVCSCNFIIAVYKLEISSNSARLLLE